MTVFPFKEIDNYVINLNWDTLYIYIKYKYETKGLKNIQNALNWLLCELHLVFFLF